MDTPARAKPIPPPNRIVKDFDVRPFPPRPTHLRNAQEDNRLDAVLLGILYGVGALALLAWVLS